MQVFVVESLYCRENATKKSAFADLSVLYLGHNLGHSLGHPRILLALGYGLCLQFVRPSHFFKLSRHCCDNLAASCATILTTVLTQFPTLQFRFKDTKKI